MTFFDEEWKTALETDEPFILVFIYSNASNWSQYEYVIDDIDNQRHNFDYL